MPNHFHILIVRNGSQKTEKAIQTISAVYTKYINRRYGVVGHLFQGRYKKKKITDIVYFEKIVKYINENPQELDQNTLFILKENDTLINYYRLVLALKMD